MQNTSPIFSAPAGITTTATFRRMKIGTTGAIYAGAADKAVGTSISGWNDPGGDDVISIQDLHFGLHFATTGNATAIVPGDLLEALADGKVGKKAAGDACGVAMEGSTSVNSVIRVKYF